MMMIEKEYIECLVIMVTMVMMVVMATTYNTIQGNLHRHRCNLLGHFPGRCPAALSLLELESWIFESLFKRWMLKAP